MDYSDRAKRLVDSPTLAIAAKAKALKASGVDVISFSAGQPNFPTPEHIKDAGIEAINTNQTGYTASSGTPELRAAVAEWMTREVGVKYGPEQILISPGAKFAISLTILATVNPGEEVIFAAPYWVSYPEMVGLADGKSVIAVTDRQSGFKMTPDQLDALITPKTRMVLLNSPSNPTGALYSAKEIKALAEVLSTHPNIWILSDEIYSRLIFDDVKHFSIAAVSVDMANRTAVVNGVSKAFSMTGWRLGWIAGPAELIANAGKMQSHTTSCPSSISQFAARKAVTSPDAFLDEMLSAYRRRRDLFVELLRDIDGIIPFVPQGAFYLFCDIRHYLGKRTPSGEIISSCLDFAGYLLDEARIAAVPGGAFGMDGYIRFSFACSDENIREGVMRIEKALVKLS